MASCFMAQIHAETNNTKESSKMWIKCMTEAKPAFVHQYSWFMKVKQEKIAYCIDTSNIVSGYNKTRNKYNGANGQVKKKEKKKESANKFHAHYIPSEAIFIC